MQAPPWLAALVEQICGCVRGENDVHISLGWEWRQPANCDDSWQLTMYPMPAVAMNRGGAWQIAYPGVIVCVTALLKHLDPDPHIDWLYPSLQEPVHDAKPYGPSIVLAGFKDGRPLELEIFSDAPPDEEPDYAISADGDVRQLAPGEWESLVMDGVEEDDD